MTTRIIATASLESGLGEEERVRCCEALERLGEDLPELSRSHASPHLEGSLGAGDLIWDFALSPDASALGELRARLDRDGWTGIFGRADSKDGATLARLAKIEAWIVDPVDSNVSRAGLLGIKRTNFVRVLDSADSAAVAQWTAECVVLAERVPAIRNWSFGRVTALAPTSPRVRWTHVWEQEFEQLEGLVEDYMASPYHWGFLDGWYDPEMPHCIMDPDLAHLYCSATQPILSSMD